MAFSTQSECVTTSLLNSGSNYLNDIPPEHGEIHPNLANISDLSRSSSHLRNNVFRFTRFKIKSKLDDIKRFLRTSRWHLSLPFKRPYPAPEFVSLQALQVLHNQYFRCDSPFFEIATNKKSPKKTAEMVQEILQSSQEPQPPRFIEPLVKVIYEKLWNTYRHITKECWHNTEPKNGCIGLLFAYILTALNDNNTNFESLNSFLQAAVYNKQIFRGTSQVILKSSKAINSTISLIDSIKAKISQEEDKNEAIERTLHKLRNVLQLYLSESIDMVIVLLSHPKMLTKGFNIVDCNSITSSSFQEFSPSLQDFLWQAHAILLYTNQNMNKAIPEINAVSLLHKKHHKNIHALLKYTQNKHNSEDSLALPLIHTVEEFLSHLYPALALYETIYWANKGDKNFSESLPAIESNLKRRSYIEEIVIISQHTRSAIETLDHLIPQLQAYSDHICNDAQKMRRNLLNENDYDAKPSYQNWIKNNLVSFLNKRVKSNDYLEQCVQCIKEHEKKRSIEGQETSQQERKEILMHFMPPSLFHQKKSDESAPTLKSHTLRYRVTA